MSARALAALLGSLLGLSACDAEPTPPTQIVVVVASDLGVPEQLDELTVELDSVRATDPATADLTSRGLPRTLGLIHTGGPLGPFVVTARGLLAGAPVVEQSARVSFITKRTLELRLTLTAACAERAAECTDGQTCLDGECVARDRDVLPVFAGTVDAGAANDASMPDADSAIPPEPDTGVEPPEPPDLPVKPFTAVNASAAAEGSARIDTLAADSNNQLHTAVNRRLAHFDGKNLAAALELRGEGEDDDEPSLADVELRDLVVDEANGSAYLATPGGLAVCEFSPSVGIGSCVRYTKENGLPDNNVEAVALVTGAGIASVVVTGGPKGLFVLSSAGSPDQASGVARLPDVKVRALVALGGTVWIAADGGLYAHDVGANTTKVYSESTGAPGKILSALAAGSDGSLWVGSPMGLGHFVPGTASWTVWRMGGMPAPGLVMNDVRAIAIARGTLVDGASRDIVWIGTGAGVSRFDPAAASFTTFAMSSGLPSNSVRSVVVLPNGTKVFGTDNGAASFTGP